MMWENMSTWISNTFTSNQDSFSTLCDATSESGTTVATTTTAKTDTPSNHSSSGYLSQESLMQVKKDLDLLVNVREDSHLNNDKIMM